MRVREVQLAEARATAEQLRAKATPPCRCGGSPTDGLVVGGDGGLTPQVLVDALASESAVGSLAGDGCGSGGEALIAGLAKLLGQWVGAMNRRELLQLLGWATSTAAAPPILASLNPDEQERLAGVIATPNRVDQKVVDNLRTIHRYCKQQNDALGSRAVMETALAQRNLVLDLLKDCPTDLRPALLSTYSDMSSSIGFYFFDQDDFDRAWHHRRQARAAAQEANNTELEIHALCEMSYTASSQGNTDAALDAAEAAQRLSGKSEDILMRVCVADKTARAYAVEGRYDECMAEFEKAQSGLTSGWQRSVESPAYFYSEGFLLAQKTYWLLRLDKPVEAAHSARSALALLDKQFAGPHAFCQLRLGQCYLLSKEIEEAAKVVGDAVDLAARTRSIRLIKELQLTRARMQPWNNTQAVKALDDQLASYGLATSVTS